ncbi:hypothetical protein MG5_05489 [Candida albicans P57072]|nr:hypothetical protein MG5_05489 [Candida albicans P57072]
MMCTTFFFIFFFCLSFSHLIKKSRVCVCLVVVVVAKQICYFL